LLQSLSDMPHIPDSLLQLQLQHSDPESATLQFAVACLGIVQTEDLVKVPHVLDAPQVASLLDQAQCAHLPVAALIKRIQLMELKYCADIGRVLVLCKQIDILWVFKLCTAIVQALARLIAEPIQDVRQVGDSFVEIVIYAMNLLKNIKDEKQMIFMKYYFIFSILHAFSCDGELLFAVMTAAQRVDKMPDPGKLGVKKRDIEINLCILHLLAKSFPLLLEFTLESTVTSFMFLLNSKTICIGKFSKV
jgi:hypothetical protein